MTKNHDKLSAVAAMSIHNSLMPRLDGRTIDDLMDEVVELKEQDTTTGEVWATKPDVLRAVEAMFTNYSQDAIWLALEFGRRDGNFPFEYCCMLKPPSDAEFMDFLQIADASEFGTMTEN